ncbi:MAG: hypothetical protein ACLFQV_03350 [Vulcanimicrobiota bacterium]
MYLVFIQAADACGFMFMMIVFGVIVFSVLKNSQKLTDMSGGKGATPDQMLGNFLSSSMGIKQQGQSSNGLVTGNPYSLPVRKGPPINWRLIKMNMTKDQMQKCFDLDKLRQGVKKRELYKYVHLDRLKNYFSEAQLRDMIDLEFFEKSQEKSEPKPLGGLNKSFEASIQEKSFESFFREDTGTELVSEQANDTVADEKVEEKVPDETVEEKVPDETVDFVKLIRNEDSFFGDIAESLPREKQLELLSKVKQKTSKTRQVKLGGAVNGIIWSEILKRKNIGESFDRSIMTRR